MEWMLLPLKRYADFSGRSRRMEFWMFTLLTVLIYFAAAFVLIAVAAAAGSGERAAREPGFIAAMIGLAVVWLGLLLPSIAVQVRRFHDQNLSGGFVALTFGLSILIPFVGWIVTIIFMSLPGTVGPNRFGADPLDPAGERHLGEVFG